MTVFLILLLLACSRDPRLEAARGALDEWKEGVTALEKNDPLLARKHFAEASRRRPKDPVVLAWEARACAASGDLDAAIGLLDAALVERPSFVEARYNRAAYLARRGEPEDAALDLEAVLKTGPAGISRTALEDPDFAQWLDHPAFVSILPRAALTVAVDAPTGSVFWGSEFRVRMRIVGAERAPIGVTAEVLAGPMRLVEAVEDELESTDGPQRDVSWTLRVTGAGEIVLGPFDIVAGHRSTHLEAIRIEAKAPPGKEAAEGAPPVRLFTPMERIGNAQAPYAFRREGEVDVLVTPVQRFEIEPRSPGEGVRYEYRRGGQPEKVLWVFPGAEGARRVRVTENGRVVLDEKVR